jgi:hypothetical protein
LRQSREDYIPRRSLGTRENEKVIAKLVDQAIEALGKMARSDQMKQNRLDAIKSLPELSDPRTFGSIALILKNLKEDSDPQIQRAALAAYAGLKKDPSN